jgi:WbqC-like protein family
MRICIIQSCYIPWKGFFDLIARCDKYVIYDSAQYSKGHWHNRNRIKGPNGSRWLTIPVSTAGRLAQSIDQVEIAKPWADEHWRLIELSYKQAAFFNEVGPLVKSWYEEAETAAFLTEVNLIFLKGVARFLGIHTDIVRDRMYSFDGARMERLLSIARASGANRYLSGPAAKEYFDEALFRSEGILTEWMDYEGYPEHPQLHGGFEHAVSVLDLIFNVGTEAWRYLKWKDWAKLSNRST